MSDRVQSPTDQRVPDFTIVGGGVIGIAVARELVSRRPYRVAVLEKESSLARHASGRNSGVLHAGFYYPPGSLKATFCREGNALLKDLCRKRGLPLSENGKVVVARDKQDLHSLHELEKRGKANGVPVRLIDEKELGAIEPHARTYTQALYSPTTAVVDPVKVCESLAADAKSNGVEFLLDTALTAVKRERHVIVTSKGEMPFRHLINCAGAYADRIAHLFGVGLEYRLLPFRGNYYELVPQETRLVRSNIYPVPDLRNPFLGVHFTKTVYGGVIVGPTAMPVFGREAYRGVTDSEWGEVLPILATEISLWLRNQANFRAIARDEIRRYLKPWFVREAKRLVPDVRGKSLVPSNHRGIRAQLVSLRERKLVSDFVIAREEGSTHILNAVSPAFTCSLPFAKYVVDTIERQAPSVHGEDIETAGDVARAAR